MAFDFPSSPTVGQSYTPAGGPTYVWDGFAWGQSDVTPVAGRGSFASSLILFSGGVQIRDIAVPADFNQIDLGSVALVNNTASAYLYAQLMTGGTGTPGGLLTGGTALTPGGSYAGCLSGVTTGATSQAWASNIQMTGAMAVNSSTNGKLALRNVSQAGIGSWVEADGQHAWSAGSGHNFTTGYVAYSGNVITGVRIGLTAGLFSSGVVRMFWT